MFWVLLVECLFWLWYCLEFARFCSSPFGFLILCIADTICLFDFALVCLVCRVLFVVLVCLLVL